MLSFAPLVECCAPDSRLHRAGVGGRCRSLPPPRPATRASPSPRSCSVQHLAGPPVPRRSRAQAPRRRPAPLRRAARRRSSSLSSAATSALVVSVGYFVWRLFLLMKRRLLWRVRRKLILSYIFIGVVPALLIIAFFMLGAFVLSINVSAYLFKRRLRRHGQTTPGWRPMPRRRDRAESCGRRRDCRAGAAECQQRRPAIPPVVDRLRAERRRRTAARAGRRVEIMPRRPTSIPVWLHGNPPAASSARSRPRPLNAAGDVAADRPCRGAGAAEPRRLGYVIVDVPIDGQIFDASTSRPASRPAA